MGEQPAAGCEVILITNESYILHAGGGRLLTLWGIYIFTYNEMMVTVGYHLVVVESLHGHCITYLLVTTNRTNIKHNCSCKHAQ